ncbi:hypothetical protein [Pseudomonas putida]|uniref:hypothetical protein n=1 Tax=Pseudomonas putida TaxID=303 RepID=UPI00210C666E|nr:hypothetical protein [Pseudomonas putida]
MHKHMIKGAAFSLLASALFAATAHADGGITFAGWGGAPCRTPSARRTWNLPPRR